MARLRNDADKEAKTADTTTTGENRRKKVNFYFINQIRISENHNQPPLPLKIVGTGFGYVSGLPLAMANPLNVVITNTSTAHLNWSTNDNSLGNCQVYISDWTDTAISLLVGLPGPGVAVNGAGTSLVPTRDMSPLSFFQSPVNTCPVVAGDTINVSVTNPQHPGTTSQLASATGILNYTTAIPF